MTVAWGTTAPEGSVIWPLSVPVEVWAGAADATG